VTFPLAQSSDRNYNINLSAGSRWQRFVPPQPMGLGVLVGWIVRERLPRLGRLQGHPGSPTRPAAAPRPPGGQQRRHRAARALASI
jgi:hypothetical protein